MKKLKTLGIITLLAIAPVEVAKGNTMVGYHWGWWGPWHFYLGILKVETSNVPFLSVLTGGHARITLGDFYRVQPFVQFGGYVQWRESGNTINVEAYYRRGLVGTWHNRSSDIYEFHLQRNNWTLTTGIDFRITDKNFIRTTAFFENRTHGFGFSGSSIGYVRKQRFSDRIGLDINVEFIHKMNNYTGTHNRVFHGSQHTQPRPTDNLTREIRRYSQHIGFRSGIKLIYEIVPNFRLEAGVNYLNIHRIRGASSGFDFQSPGRDCILGWLISGWSMGDPGGELKSHPAPDFFTRNIIKVSVGVHYKIPLRL